MGFIGNKVLLPNQMIVIMEDFGDPQDVMIEAVKKHLDNIS